MREIKFRGKRKDNNEWVYGNLVAQGAAQFIYVYMGGHKNDIYQVIPETVGQFTGLKDSLGVTIYEGDICQIITKKSLVHASRSVRTVGVVEHSKIFVRDNSLYEFETFNIKGGSISKLLKYDLEVVTNVHDDPSFASIL